mgnify:CR=1 FL=1
MNMFILRVILVNLYVMLFRNNLLEEENHYIVIEMSNFQLLDIDKFRPEISTVINLTPDHLDYMASLDEYYASKMRIYENCEVMMKFLLIILMMKLYKNIYKDIMFIVVF